jgi:hypothetical protein
VWQFVLRTAAALVFLHDYWVLVPEAVAALEEREAAYEALLLMREELQERQAAAAAAATSRDKRMAALYTSAEALQVRRGNGECMSALPFVGCVKQGVHESMHAAQAARYTLCP